MSYTLIRLARREPEMAGLDVFTWAEGLAFISHDVRVGVRVTDAALWPRLMDRLPPDWTVIPPRVDRIFSIVAGGADVSSGHTLYDGGEAILHSHDLDHVLDQIESRIRLHVATASSNRLFVHAGVVGWHGRAIVIPGESRSGKSELVMALTRAGASYYSDEYAVFDAQGLVHPYARPLALRNADGESKRRIAIGAMTSAVGTDALPVGAVVVTRFSPQATWRPRPLSGGEALLALVANTVRARLDPPVVLKRLSHAIRNADRCESARGEAAASAGAILEHCYGTVIAELIA